MDLTEKALAAAREADERAREREQQYERDTRQAVIRLLRLKLRDGFGATKEEAERAVFTAIVNIAGRPRWAAAAEVSSEHGGLCLLATASDVATENGGPNRAACLWRPRVATIDTTAPHNVVQWRGEAKTLVELGYLIQRLGET